MQTRRTWVSEWIDLWINCLIGWRKNMKMVEDWRRQLKIDEDISRLRNTVADWRRCIWTDSLFSDFGVEDEVVVLIGDVVRGFPSRASATNPKCLKSPSTMRMRTSTNMGERIDWYMHQLFDWLKNMKTVEDWRRRLKIDEDISRLTNTVEDWRWGFDQTPCLAILVLKKK